MTNSEAIIKMKTIFGIAISINYYVVFRIWTVSPTLHIVETAQFLTDITSFELEWSVIIRMEFPIRRFKFE